MEQKYLNQNTGKNFEEPEYLLPHQRPCRYALILNSSEDLRRDVEFKRLKRIYDSWRKDH